MLVKEWLNDKTHHLAEIYATGLQMALLSPDGEQATMFGRCKDFSLNAHWSQINHQPSKIYGFIYDPTQHPALPTNVTRVLLRNPNDKQFLVRVVNAVKFHNLLAAEFKFGNAELVAVENPAAGKPTALIEAPAEWMHAPPMLSLLLLTLRVGMMFDGKMAWEQHVNAMIAGWPIAYNFADKEPTYDLSRPGMDGRHARFTGYDGKYLEISLSTIKRLIDGWRTAFHKDRAANYPATVSVGVMTNFGGIVAYAQGEHRKRAERPGMFSPDEGFEYPGE